MHAFTKMEINIKFVYIEQYIMVRSVRQFAIFGRCISETRFTIEFLECFVKCLVWCKAKQMQSKRTCKCRLWDICKNVGISCGFR